MPDHGRDGMDLGFAVPRKKWNRIDGIFFGHGEGRAQGMPVERKGSGIFPRSAGLRTILRNYRGVIDDCCKY
ncbi:hypothetical protein [Novosphingobium sp. KA1]|uniref:hypothetical protein n=1 Tax=Novosphingobium sp. (strain KA1) TaxID=164608 RepID=UPI001A8D5ED2|nr:hypothetical protein [Novosphingobium sp. KA1]